MRPESKDCPGCERIMVLDIDYLCTRGRGCLKKRKPADTGRVVVIGFCGLAGSGKTTAARVLERGYGFNRRPFAGPLKAMARTILDARQMAADLKETPSPTLCGKSPRQFLQLLGTEFGRQMIGEDFWVNLWRREVRALAAETFGDILVVADDVRFANEAAAIRAFGGPIIRIDRPGAGSATGGAHASEALAFDVDGVIRNHGNEPAFAEAVADMVADYAWGGR